MGCGASAEAVPGSSDSKNNQANGRAPVDSNPVSSEAASLQNKNASGPAQGETATQVVGDAVMSFSVSDTDPPVALKRVTEKPPPKPIDADLAEVDRLLELPDSELKSHRLSLRNIEDAPTTPPSQQSRAPGLSGADVDSRSQQAEASSATHGFLPPIGKPQPGSVATSSELNMASLPDGAEEDPWASLQSKYKVGEQGQGQGPSKRSSAKKKFEDDDDDDDVVLMEANDAKSGGYTTPSAVKISTRGPPQRAGPGGWGNGDLAQAGTLMMGGDDTSYKTAAQQPRGLPPGDQGGDMAEAANPIYGNKDGELGMEDMDDVDALLAEEMAASGINDDLKIKLAKFEAMNGDEE